MHGCIHEPSTVVQWRSGAERGGAVRGGGGSWLQRCGRRGAVPSQAGRSGDDATPANDPGERAAVGRIQFTDRTSSRSVWRPPLAVSPVDAAPGECPGHIARRG